MTSQEQAKTPATKKEEGESGTSGSGDDNNTFSDVKKQGTIILKDARFADTKLVSSVRKVVNKLVSGFKNLVSNCNQEHQSAEQSRGAERD